MNQPRNAPSQPECRSLAGKAKPSCPSCGGPMERMAWGGTDAQTGRPSRLESWRCVAAFQEFLAERQRLLDELHERHAGHIRWTIYERVPA